MQVLDEKRLENATIEMNIEVPGSRVDVEYKSVLEKISKEAKIDGFRKGKAPIQMVESRYKQTAEREVLENILRDTYIEALKAKNHSPIGDPVFDFNMFEMGKPFTYKVKFEVAPTVELGEYKGLEVSRRACMISEEDIDREVDVMRYRNANISQKAEGGVIENGDQVKIKMKRIDNVPPEQVEGVEFREYTFVCGKSQNDLSMDRHVVGMKAGESKEVEISYPADYEVKDLAGQNVRYLVEIAEVNTMELPALDDEFAKDLGEYSSLADLRARIRENLTSYVGEVVRQECASALLQKIIETSIFDIPESLIVKEMDVIFNRLKSRFGVPANTVQEFCDMMGFDIGEMNENLREEALKDLKLFLVRLEISKREEIKVTEQQFEEAVELMSRRYGRPADEMKKYIDENNMRDNYELDILMKNVHTYLVEQAKVADEAPVSLESFLKKGPAQA